MYIFTIYLICVRLCSTQLKIICEVQENNNSYCFNNFDDDKLNIFKKKIENILSEKKYKLSISI